MARIVQPGIDDGYIAANRIKLRACITREDGILRFTTWNALGVMPMRA